MEYCLKGMITAYQQRTQLYPTHNHMANHYSWCGDDNCFCMDASKVMTTLFAHHEGEGNQSISNPTMNQSKSSVKMW